MSPKTIVFLTVIFTGLLVLALGGWLVKGTKALTDPKPKPSLRPRFA
jgi:hypothetical protein